MKILQIKFKNINSLKGEHFIDFEAEPLKSNALFAITGPTGSGKSTLLDVICLALFNKVPRMGKVSKSEIAKTGSVITRHQKQAFAQVTYQCKSGKFLSHWDIQYNRNNNLNDYEMQLKNLITNEEFDLKKSEVPSKNEDLIGLNYEQFIKSILLAQGEFSKFLKASDNDRKQILEQITGTEIYRKIGMLAYEKSKQVKSAIDLDLQRISDLQEKLLEEERTEKLQTELAAAKLQKNKESDKLSKFKTQIELAERRKKLVLKLENYQKERAKLLEQQVDFKEKHSVKLQNHQKTQAFAEDLQVRKDQKKQFKKLEKDKQSILLLLDNLTKQEVQHLEEVNNLIKQPVQADLMVERLEDFRKKVVSIDLELKDVRKTFSIQQKALGEKLQQLGVQSNLNKINETVNRLTEYQQKWQRDFQNTSEFINQHDSITKNLQDVTSALNQKIEFSLEAKQLEQRKVQLNKKKSELGIQLKELEKKISTHQQELSLAEKALVNAKTKLENLQLKWNNQRLIQHFEDHRKKLQPGEECPLCGSLEHPFIEDAVSFESDLEVKISDSKKGLQQLEKQLKKLQNLVVAQAKEKENNEQQIKDLETELTSIKLQWKADFNQLQQEKNHHSWEEFVVVLKKIQQGFKEKDELEQKLSLISPLFSALDELQRLIEQGQSLKHKLASVYSGDDVDIEVSTLKSSWDKNQQQQLTKKEDLKKLQTQLSNLATDFKQREAKLQDLIEQVGFLTIEESQAARMKEDVFQDLLNQENEFSSQLKIINQSLENTQEQLDEMGKDFEANNLLELENKKKETEITIQNLDKEILNLTNQLLNQDNLVKEIKIIRSRVEEERKRSKKWLLLNELIGDARGAKFNNFAQDLTLMHLLAMANHRLTKLNDRYQMDRPKNAEGEDLVVIDLHMGSERRSVKTLSGGETFMLSLALALALSDLASQNVKIDSLFIDEGFGTLDPETLDQTLDTLERLQAESNKIIGIISHVEALKERIQTQIQLTKNGQGYSSLTVVN